MSTHSPDDKGESYDGKEVENVEGGEDEGEEDEELEGEDDGDEGEGDETTLEGGDSKSPEDGHTRPFILPKMWTVNDFKPTMTTNIFKNLRDHYQIPNNVPIHLPRKFEKCYSRKTADVDMYDAMFATRLRLPLTALHRQLANFLRLSVSQIAPNAWRIFIGAEILWGRLSGGNRQLTLDEFFWCYRPQHIVSSHGIYHFAVRKKALRLVSDMPDSNRNWNGRYFFFQGTD